MCFDIHCFVYWRVLCFYVQLWVRVCESVELTILIFPLILWSLVYIIIILYLNGKLNNSGLKVQLCPISDHFYFRINILVINLKNLVFKFQNLAKVHVMKGWRWFTTQEPLNYSFFIIWISNFLLNCGKITIYWRRE